MVVPFSVFLFLVGWDYVMASWSVLEGSREAGGLSGLFLWKTCMLVFVVLLGLQGISLALRSLMVILGQEDWQSSSESGDSEGTHAA